MLKSLVLSLIPLTSSLLAAENQPKYNLIAIVTDDQAAWTIGCYGGKEIATPNLDRIAASGTKFTNAFIQTPVCSPSRGTYLTSKLPTELGYCDYLNEKQSRTLGINHQFPTWPETLSQHGYATGLVGKWHVGHNENSLPWKNGITSFQGNLLGGWATKNFKFINEKNESSSHPGFSVEVCTDLAIQYTTAHKNEPFALLVHYREPHGAYVPMPDPDMVTSKNANIQTPNFPGLKQPHTDNQRRDYYASIAAVDRNIGRILDHLKSSGLDKNTIVMFTSDHGYNIGEHGIHHKGNGRKCTEVDFGQSRPNMFDTSIRVPLLIHHPDGKANHSDDSWVTQADVFSSVVHMLQPNTTPTTPASSRDFSPALFGKSLDPKIFPHSLFGQYDLINDAPTRYMRMIRTDKWKLVLHLNTPQNHELYDLTTDPTESNNVFSNPSNTDTIRTLTEQIRKKMQEINDPRLNLLP